MLIDRGTYWEDTEAKFTPVYDKKTGEYIGGFYCPYIPKCIVAGSEIGSTDVLEIVEISGANSVNVRKK